jgi:hypothetical protein
MAKSLRKRKKKVVVMYAIAMHIYIIPHILFIVLDLTLEYEHDPSFSEDGPVRMSQSSLAIQFPRTRNAHLPTIDVVDATAAVALTHANQSPHSSPIDRTISPAKLLARPSIQRPLDLYLRSSRGAASPSSSSARATYLPCTRAPPVARSNTFSPSPPRRHSRLQIAPTPPPARHVVIIIAPPQNTITL